MGNTPLKEQDWRRQATDASKILIPSEVVTPSLGSWVVEGYDHSIDRIRRFNLGVFVTVAPWTGQGQVVHSGFPAATDRYDMFHRK